VAGLDTADLPRREAEPDFTSRPLRNQNSGRPKHAEMRSLRESTPVG
jgi:hypothetical protein